MSIFATKPEEPAETPGVPSEPERGHAAAEHLDDVVADAASLGISGVTSVAISMPQPPVTDEQH